MDYSANNIDNTQLPKPNIGVNSGSANTKTFTKEQVNKIVEDRLKKERVKLGALKDLKDAVTNLYKRGYFDKYKDAPGKNLSISDMAGILMEEVKGKTTQTGNTAETGYKSQAKANSSEPNSSQDLTKPSNVSSRGPENTGNAKTPPKWSMNSRIFEMFAKNKNLPKEEIFSEYLKFVEQVEQAQSANTDIRRISQTEQNYPNFNANHTGENPVDVVGKGYVAGNNSDNSYNGINHINPENMQGNNFYNNAEHILGTNNQNYTGSNYNSIPTAQDYRRGENFTLTERQKDLARAGGMTYKEYNEFYNSIPTKKLKK